MDEDQPITSKEIYYLIYGFVVFLSLGILLVYVTTSEITHIADIPEGLEEYIFIQRFLNNPECFAYQDKEILRIFPGVVDLDKFKQENLDYCYKPKEGYGFRLTINNEVRTSNFETSKKIISKHILIYKNNRFENAKIKIES